MSKTPICARKPVKSDEVHIPDATNFEYLLINAHKKEDGWTCGGVKIYDRQTTNRFAAMVKTPPRPLWAKNRQWIKFVTLVRRKKNSFTPGMPSCYHLIGRTLNSTDAAVRVRWKNIQVFSLSKEQIDSASINVNVYAVTKISYGPLVVLSFSDIVFVKNCRLRPVISILQSNPAIAPRKRKTKASTKGGDT
ncbi:hypothetical protein H4Q26_017523 [Puccinia striiformis f. sp. tritici PST-130]|nr:hypothetical protein H4Q26_017523 [Puccinia striiformis f. sp. tritici PST-130]